MSNFTICPAAARRALCVIAMIFAAGATVALRAGVEQSGLGPRAVDSFGLEHPEQTSDSETAKIGPIKNPFGDVKIPDGLLKSTGGGSILLYSVARLSESEMRNPFEVRVQVAVDVLETIFEIGGIVEAADGSGNNTVILLTKPPKVRPAGNQELSKTQEAKEKKEKPISAVCSVGDIVDGFRIYAIGRHSIIVEQGGKYVEITRGRPVVVAVPLSAQ